MGDLVISYELVGTGWARMVLTKGADQFVLEELSYLDEPLHDLLLAGLEAALRRVPSVMEFDNEGAGFTRLSFDWADPSEPPDRLPFVIELSSRRRSEAGWSKPKRLAVTNEEFATAVLRCAEDVRARHDLEDYGWQWFGEGFPVRATEALRAALAVEEPVGPKYTAEETEV